ncbi:hypothetical protein SPRG_14758 [Saprolegnia parasitica CBS 223.65]|uniref:Uncharacterized protein n=1 Tax=Saprolegnia parasitica (strain CBS 223.65) TaxID=695850 RepID=A0A067BN91_SAPPC|nr:hypothetical protein SPRG_14758 [Saprolegnia parasitica CBS 223.65]KDO19678.1 hypothetical protein SPRG_14758 [Saprolegnia parasitica CBS 223.65]|eukprot:XP_012209595.1 hypothetical protein SPRG_14758 [Saprolegnia parasitica CBS 223.65]
MQQVCDWSMAVPVARGRLMPMAPLVMKGDPGSGRLVLDLSLPVPPPRCAVGIWQATTGVKKEEKFPSPAPLVVSPSQIPKRPYPEEAYASNVRNVRRAFDRRCSVESPSKSSPTPPAWPQQRLQAAPSLEPELMNAFVKLETRPLQDAAPRVATASHPAPRASWAALSDFVAPIPIFVSVEAPAPTAAPTPAIPPELEAPAPDPSSSMLLEDTEVRSPVASIDIVGEDADDDARDDDDRDELPSQPPMLDDVDVYYYGGGGYGWTPGNVVGEVGEMYELSQDGH